MTIQRFTAKDVSAKLVNNEVFGIDVVSIREYTEKNTKTQETKFLFDFIESMRLAYSTEEIDDFVICTKAAAEIDFRSGMTKSGLPLDEYVVKYLIPTHNVDINGVSTKFYLG